MNREQLASEMENLEGLIRSLNPEQVRAVILALDKIALSRSNQEISSELFQETFYRHLQETWPEPVKFHSRFRFHQPDHHIEDDLQGR